MPSKITSPLRLRTDTQLGCELTSAIGPSGVITATPNRSELWAAQTPQAFSVDELRQGHREARANGWTVTDDASLYERLGWPVNVLDAGPSSLSSVAHQPNHRGDVDDATTPLLQHWASHCPRTEEDSGEIEIDHRLPILGFHPHQQAIPRNPRVIHQHVNASTALQHRFDQVFD